MPAAIFGFIKNNIMISATPSIVMPDYRKYTVWLITMAIVAFGFSYAKGIIAFVLDKLYQFFIQNNPGQFVVI